MEPTTIIAGAMALLVPYATKAGESFAAEVGKTAFAKTKTIIAWIGAKLSDNPANSDVLRRFESDPERYKPFLEDILTERIEKDPAFAQELSRQLHEIKKAAPSAVVVQEMEQAEKVVGARVNEMTKGTISVKQNIKDAHDVTGVDIDKM